MASVRSQEAEGEGEEKEEKEEGQEAKEKAGEWRRETVVRAVGSRTSAAATASEEERGRGAADAGRDPGNGKKDGPAGKGKVDKDRQKAERGRRILNTIDLVETLVGGFLPPCC